MQRVRLCGVHASVSRISALRKPPGSVEATGIPSACKVRSCYGRTYEPRTLSATRRTRRNTRMTRCVGLAVDQYAGRAPPVAGMV